MKEKCNYIQPWAGACQKDKGRCQAHDDLKCSCGKPATRGCGQMAAFVCGAPICDDCDCKLKH